MNMYLKIVKRYPVIEAALLTFLITVLFYTPCYSEDIQNVITISEGLKIATEKNRIIKISAFNKDISRADTLVAKSRFFPTIEITAISARYNFWINECFHWRKRIPLLRN